MKQINYFNENKSMKINNNFYRQSTCYMTKRGMVPISELLREDEVYYLNSKNELKTVSDVSVISKRVTEFNQFKGRHLFLESTTLFSYDNYKDNFIEITPTNLKSIKVSASNVLINNPIRDSFGITEIDFNDKIYSLDNLNKLMITFYVTLHYNYFCTRKLFVKKDYLSDKLYSYINLKIHDKTGIYIGECNNSNWLSTKSTEDCILYFYRHPDLFISFLNYLEELSISFGYNGKKIISFPTFKLAHLFQALISLFGFKSYISYKNKVYNLIYYKYSDTLVTKVKCINHVELSKPELFYNLYLPVDDARYLITSNMNKINSICYALPYKES